MKLTLLSQLGCNSMALPEKYAGHYWIRGKTNMRKMSDIVAVEALRSIERGSISQWVLKSNRRFKILDKDNNELQNMPLNPLALYRIQSANGNLTYILYTEPLSDDRKCYARRPWDLQKPWNGRLHRQALHLPGALAHFVEVPGAPEF